MGAQEAASARLFKIKQGELLVGGGAVVGDGEGAAAGEEEVVAFFCEGLVVDEAVCGGAGEADDEDGGFGAGHGEVHAGGEGHAEDADAFGVEEHFGVAGVHHEEGGVGCVREFDIHDVEFDGVFIPYAVDAGSVLEAFEPDVAVGEGGFAGFDEDLGACFCIA